MDEGHGRHGDVKVALDELGEGAAVYLSTISLAELAFGVKLAEAFAFKRLPFLRDMLVKAQQYNALPVTHHTSMVYAELKANLARKYLAKAMRHHRPRWLEEWVDKASGQSLQVDENDLWICSQGKERGLIVVTTDKGMSRIEAADNEVRVLIL